MDSDQEAPAAPAAHAVPRRMADDLAQGASRASREGAGRGTRSAVERAHHLQRQEGRDREARHPARWGRTRPDGLFTIQLPPLYGRPDQEAIPWRAARASLAVDGSRSARRLA